MKETIIGEGGYVYKQETLLTVLKTSLFFANDGYSVYDCKGQLVFRVDSYGPDTRDKGEIVLMDAHGKCLLTVRRKVWTCSSFSQIFFFFVGGRVDSLSLVWAYVFNKYVRNLREKLNFQKKGLFINLQNSPIKEKKLTFKILSQLGESFILSTILLNSV